MSEQNKNVRLCPICHHFIETLDGNFKNHTPDTLSKTICIASEKPVDFFGKCRKCNPNYCNFLEKNGVPCPDENLSEVKKDGTKRKE